MFGRPAADVHLSAEERARIEAHLRRESCTLAENLQARAERDSIRLTMATLQEEGEVPVKKAAKSGINFDQEFKKIMLDSSDPTKMALIRIELDDK